MEIHVEATKVSQMLDFLIEITMDKSHPIEARLGAASLWFRIAGFQE
jgi:hypothetical protein